MPSPRGPGDDTLIVVTTCSPSRRFTRDMMRGVERWISLAQWRFVACTVRVPPEPNDTLVTRSIVGPTAAAQASATLPGDNGWSWSSSASAEVAQCFVAIIDQTLIGLVVPRR